jgi:hypothetical protein
MHPRIHALTHPLTQSINQAFTPANKSSLNFFGLVAVSGMASSMFLVPARAQTAVCTPAFTAYVAQDSVISAVQTGSSPPCSASPATLSINVGSGVGENAGVVFLYDIIDGFATNNFTRTSVSSVGIGSPANTSTLFFLNFSQPIQDPYLFFTYLDPNTSFTFSQPFALAQANNANVAGQTVTENGATNSQNSGFVIGMLGAYSTLSFSYNNNNATFATSVAFTAGGTPVPGPLPLLGAGGMFAFSRKLRRRIQA